MELLGGLRNRHHRLGFEEAVTGYLFVLPAVLGLVLFNLGPMIASLYWGFTQYDIVSPARFIGLNNYVKLFTNDSMYTQSIKVTLKYAVLSLPLTIVTAYVTALLMNQGVKGVSLYRTLWYLPSLVPGVANGVLWAWLLNREFGPINWPIREVGLPAPGWLTDPTWLVPSLVLIRVWGVGNMVLLFLAGLKGVPQHLYEAAEVDGANWWKKFCHITIPMTSSIIFFNLVMGIISSFQVFGIAYIMFNPDLYGTAGPENSALFYVLYLYRNAFFYFKNGYACAMAWVLFVAILMLTLATFRTQKLWVYYEAERGVR